METYAASVAKISSARSLSIAAAKDWEIQSMDVDMAFLQSFVEEEIYIKQPKKYEKRGANGEELVCKLAKLSAALSRALATGTE